MQSSLCCSQQLSQPQHTCSWQQAQQHRRPHAVASAARRTLAAASCHHTSTSSSAPQQQATVQQQRRRCRCTPIAAAPEQQPTASTTQQPQLVAQELLHGKSQPASTAAQPEPATSSSSSNNNTQQQQQPPLQVTRHNFQQVLPALREALAGCQFYAFDCEMSGLYPPGLEDYVNDDVDDRYLKTAAAAESFLVTQMGLSLFTWRDEGSSSSHYEARSFNFHLFPSPSEELDLRFSCQASSLAFLASHGFDFNKMVYEGIPFLPLALRDKQLKAAADAHKAAATPPSLDELDDDEHCLMQELQEIISTWLDRVQPPPAPAAPAAGATTVSETVPSASDLLYLPAPPPQLMKLQRRLLAAGIGSSRWQGSKGSSSSTGSTGWQYIVESVEGSGTDTVLRRATSQQVAAAAAQSKQQRQQQATAAAGFSHVMELLRDSGKPAVGHNLRFDVAYILAAFVQNPLPKSWSGFKQLVGTWFPGGVYDTKYVARGLTGLGVPGATALLPDTALGPLFKPMCVSACSRQPLGTASSLSSQADSAPHLHSANLTSLREWLQQRTSALEDPSLWTVLPCIQHAPGCEQYMAAAVATAGLPQQQPADSSSSGQVQVAVGGGAGASTASASAHEAGFDAFMTGVVFVGLMRLYEISALSSLSRWMLPTAPSLPPKLECVEELANRQYHCKSKDIAYAALQGIDPMPQRPHVVYITGFKGTRPRWQDIQSRCAKVGLGKPIVSFVRDGAGTYAPIKGAYVVLNSAKDAAKAIQHLRQSTTWTVMTYADYFQSKDAANGDGGSGGPASRPAPPCITVT